MTCKISVIPFFGWTVFDQLQQSWPYLWHLMRIIVLLGMYSCDTWCIEGLKSNYKMKISLYIVTIMCKDVEVKDILGNRFYRKLYLQEEGGQNVVRFFQ